jgi:hypothetical protein
VIAGAQREVIGFAAMVTSPRPVRLGLAALVAAPTLAGALLGAGCESNDPCVRRTAACVEVMLIGRKDDGSGTPAVYRDVSVKVCAPNPGMPDAMCGDQSCGTELASTSEPLTLRPAEPYLANTQGKVSFQLPGSFNDLPDLYQTDDGQRTELALEIDDLPADERKARLLELRKTDPRAIRILVTQPGASKPAWDSRCEEGLFSDDEWAMLKYYRVGKNQALAVPAPLRDGVISPP